MISHYYFIAESVIWYFFTISTAYVTYVKCFFKEFLNLIVDFVQE